MKRVLFVTAIVLLAGSTISPAWVNAQSISPSRVSTQCDAVGIDGTAQLEWTPQLWAPNHQLRDIGLEYVDPDGTGAGVLRVDVRSIAVYPADTDGNNPDWVGATSTGATVTDDQTATPSAPVKLRAERAGQDLAGRTYVVSVTCNHDSIPKMLDICIAVPHDRHHAATRPEGVTCAAETPL